MNNLQKLREEIVNEYRSFLGSSNLLNVEMTREESAIEDFLIEAIQKSYLLGQKEERETIKEILKSLMPERPINELVDIANALRKEETMSETDKMKLVNKDNGFRIKMIEYVSKVQALTDILNALEK